LKELNNPTVKPKPKEAKFLPGGLKEDCIHVDKEPKCFDCPKNPINKDHPD